MLRKILAGAAVAFAALLATPVAANAAGYGGQGPVAETVVAGEAVSLTFSGLPANTPSTAVAPDAVTLAILKAGTASKPTDASGSVTYSASATTPGTYTITVTAGQVVATGTLTVLPTDGTGTGPGAGTGTGTGAGGSGSGGLADTGVDPVLFAWIGGGALALGAALVVVLTTVRRARNQA